MDTVLLVSMNFFWLFVKCWGDPLIHRKRKINQCIEKAPDLCYPFFISLGL